MFGFNYVTTISYTAGNTNVCHQRFMIRQIDGIAGHSGNVDYGKMWLLNVGANTCRSDFGDIRFTDGNGNELAYFITSISAGTVAYFDVRIPNANQNGVVQVWHGNPSATTTSNGGATYEMFDDFEGTAINSNLWVATGNVTVANSICNVAYNTMRSNIYSRFNYGMGYTLECRVHFTSTTATAWVGQEQYQYPATSSVQYTDHINRTTVIVGSGSTYGTISHGVTLTSGIHDIMITRTGGTNTTKVFIDGTLKVSSTPYASTTQRHPVFFAYSGGAGIDIFHVFVKVYTSSPPSPTSFVRQRVNMSPNIAFGSANPMVI